MEKNPQFDIKSTRAKEIAKSRRKKTRKQTEREF
jgi:hypothetical protein